MEQKIRSMVNVGAAGSSGAISRFLLYELGEVRCGIDHSHMTFLINIIGTFLFSFLAARIVQRSPIVRFDSDVILGGFLGAFTTFSAFVNDSVTLGDTSGIIVDSALIVTSIGLALIFAFLGAHLALKWEPVHDTQKPGKPDPDDRNQEEDE